MTTLSRRQFVALSMLAPVAMATATKAQAATHEVSIQGMAFSPASLTIAAGDSVRFTNMDGAPHTATSASAGLDTGRLRRNDSATLTFATAGSFAYICAIHPSMRGTITVT